jgi:GT2 family glycosyltransferase
MTGLSFIISTMDRPKELARFLDSLRVQSVQPDEVIIIDAGRKSQPPAVFGGPALVYRHVPGCSLTEARNIGLGALAAAAGLVAFFDDDIVFEPGSVAAMLEYWAGAPADLGGAAFNIIDQPKVRVRWLKTVFGLDSLKGGLVLRSGFNTSFCPAERDQYTQWLHGGATVWRRSIFSGDRFDEWISGYGYTEDLDFSFRVAKRYRLAVVAKARVLHLHSPATRMRNFTLGVSQAVNRYHFVSKHPELSRPAWALALVGLAICNLLRADLSRAAGNIVGMVRALSGSLPRVGASLK